MAARLLNLIALSSFLILASNFGPSPVTALSIDSSAHQVRHLGHHQLIAKKKRSNTGRCKPRPSSSSVVHHSTSSVAVVHTTPHPTTSKAAAPKPTPAPSNNAPANTGHGGNGKVGIAWAMGDDPSLKNFVTSKVSTVYTWSPFKPSQVDQLGLDFAAMLWGTKQIGDFVNLVKPGYARYALAFNEPDIQGQSNLDPGYAASLWKQYLEPLKAHGYTLISPAVTSGPGGKPWLQSFLGACSGCSVDNIALHWYGTDPQAFISYVEDFHNTFKKNIWVTEFACQSFVSSVPQCSASQVTNFMNTVTAWMDSTSYVSKYFAFGVMHDMQGVNPLDQLMAANGQPTELGWNYLT
ncbi:hypothetical protein CVT26_011401 [Gymnopilus dilepis]|uniref:Asl1-like glycosyl hydrolase catalytic domain-containing protein n=1 Tax=Gymnopilus dilepis TaxID=231916 RepID=A0A409W8R6_9AGAR|nr:hypothetical protein CVT26_011401 [Gymnopilus dilepis]